jgi:hypothetical protein
MARARSRRVSDAEYRHRYEREVRRYVTRFSEARGWIGPGAVNLDSGKWAWIDSGAQWCRYELGYGGLVAMNPDGYWRPWDPRSVGLRRRTPSRRPSGGKT